jgi:anti-anti-sigma factor
MDLIAVGNHRIVLNFSAVERLGSWIIGAVGNAHRACAAGDGGRLKICGLDAPLAEIFEIVGMARDLEFHRGEPEALESPWPQPAAPRQLPVDILNVLLALGESLPIRGGAPAEEGKVKELTPPRVDCGSLPLARSPGLDARASLRVQAGSTEPRVVRVPASGLLVGRDGHCPFRIGSAQVSKRHAVIEPRQGRVFVRDLDSTNGTSINGLTIRGQEREVFSGDTIQIGPVVSTVVIGALDEPHDSLEDLRPVVFPAEELACVVVQPDEKTAEDLPVFDEMDLEHRIKTEVIEDVLIVTPQFENLNDEATLAALRSKLQSLHESSSPRRVVVNLEFVSHLSRQAVALLLSHHIRLDWAGGGLRICQAHARIVALLDQVRLTMLVDCYPNLDEAVLASWRIARTVARP